MTDRQDVAATAIGGIGNYYGGLAVKREAGKCYWSIENYDGDDWEEIPETLFDELLRYENSREKPVYLTR